MKKNVSGLILAVACFTIIIGGCANNEVVKKEEPISPTVKAAPQLKTEPVKIEPGKVAAPSDQPVTQATIKKNSAQESVISAAKVGTLNAALEKIYFDFDSSSLSPESRKSLQKNMEIIRKDTSSVVQIEGNCDERGSAEYNLALGEKRAKAAMQYLVTMGIPTERLSVISYGKEHPAVQGSDESAWSKNRRDDFVIKK